MPYPPFDEVLAKFASFARSQNVSGELVFVSPHDAFLIRGALYIQVPEQAPARHRAKQAYEEAARRRLGVVVSAFAGLPGGALAIYVYGPKKSDEAERLMFPDGLKLSVPQVLRPAKTIRTLTAFLLRLLCGRGSIAAGLEERFT
ncbi:MAG TPA: hypothetical protein VEK57_15640 [Thermoanaerobaculia bacterium]|nr:hypothetical protein [Thermoanaerobaculia bacterium]